MLRDVIENLSEELCDAIFDEFDLDKDCTIDSDEFLRKML